MPKLISLFTGAGGLDLGFEAAGFETTVAIEMDPDAVATLRANRSWPVLDRDIQTVPSHEILTVGGLAVGEADALIGGPPCQPFSKSGYWAMVTPCGWTIPGPALWELICAFFATPCPKRFCSRTFPA